MYRVFYFNTLFWFARAQIEDFQFYTLLSTLGPSIDSRNKKERVLAIIINQYPLLSTIAH